MLITQAQKLRAALERIGLRRRISGNGIAIGRRFVDDKTATNGVVNRRLQNVTVSGESSEAHAIGMIGQRFAPMHDEMQRLVELDGMLAENMQPAVASNRFESCRDASGIHMLRGVAFQSQDHGLVAAVTLAGGAQRSVELGLDGAGARQQAARTQPVGKASRGLHGPDRMRAGGSDADAEQIEYADGHSRFSLDYLP